MKRNLPKKVLLLGSGALKIGEAGEFDYSGSQAAKALSEEGIKTVLVNPNIATIQTSHELVNKVYFLPVTSYFVEKVIGREHPDGILLSFGGQTALNCGIELAKNGVLSESGLKVLGTPVSSIIKTEDRLLFRKSIRQMGFKVPESHLCKTVRQVQEISDTIVYPVMVRAGFSLGGLGSGIARNPNELEGIASKALTLTPQVLIEEYLEHWKEIEYEVVRDGSDNAITVCNMENFDPMGIHTGESIVVAPSQTLSNQEYHLLRTIAITVVRKLPIVGECNIQYALNPKNGDYRIIEVNARLSRSSALASKATGYPLAYVAAKIALGYKLSEIENKVTRVTTAFFEPALDYVVVKIPRWDFLKFKNVTERLGSEMQSVGEVMAIGRTFEEAFQKAIRSLEMEYQGIISDEIERLTLKNTKRKRFLALDPTPSRPYNIAQNLYLGQSIEEIQKVTGIDVWFLIRIKTIVDFFKHMQALAFHQEVDHDTLFQAKLLGFSDKQIARVYGISWQKVRKIRKIFAITPKVCQIDTLAGEFPAKTNYLYVSYHRKEHDIKPGDVKQVAILGGGPYQIGSSVEFDWCAVNASMTAKKHGRRPIMINCNPETVSTDYDMSDKLYFEELSMERVLDIVDFEGCPVIASMGGQKPNILAPKLAKAGVRFLGNKPNTIDAVENREKFSGLLDKLGIKQPPWARLKSSKEARNFTKKIGFPLLLRPSYVLSGKAMLVAHTQAMLDAYLKDTSTIINPDYPIVISKFVRGAKEVDFDAVSDHGKIIVWAISEHVEHSGVHSGDATLVLPSFSLSVEARDHIKDIADRIVASLGVIGAFNVQFLVRDLDDRLPDVQVIETNLRASRSFPFVSKVLGINFIDIATRIILGEKVSPPTILSVPYFGVKVPHFSFTRLRGTDPVLRVEMASTGEVACFGTRVTDAYLKAILSTGVSYPKKNVLLSLGGEEAKQRLLIGAEKLSRMGYKIYATRQTADFLRKHDIGCKLVYKIYEGGKPNVVDMIMGKKVGLVINLSDRSDLGERDIKRESTDGYLIRRAAVESNVILLTKATIANMFIRALEKYSPEDLEIKSWDEYLKELKMKN